MEIPLAPQRRVTSKHQGAHAATDSRQIPRSTIWRSALDVTRKWVNAAYVDSSGNRRLHLFGAPPVTLADAQCCAECPCVRQCTPRTAEGV